MELKDPPLKELESWFRTSHLMAPPYHLEQIRVPIKLDQNEMPWDLPMEFKERVARKLVHGLWNRYPDPYSQNLSEAIAHHLELSPECILPGPGSNDLIRLLLDAMAPQLTAERLWILRPSFHLYESHARICSYPYSTWNLSEDFSFDAPGLSRQLKPHSLVLFASPNNPTGSYLPKEDFSRLLSKHKDSLFVADEAYFEFAPESYLSLLGQHSNIILVRTLSKSLGAAGLRVGYLVAAPPYIEQLKKLRLPFLINPFGSMAAIELLRDQDIMDLCAQRIQALIRERDRLLGLFEVLPRYPSARTIGAQANFLLLKFGVEEEKNHCYQELINAGVLLRDISRGPGLKGCLRLTVGSLEENEVLSKCLLKN